jgi:hypothetical protein
MMLAVLGGLAVERDLIRTRTAEGRSRAKAPVPSRRPSRKRPADAARRALRCKNWRKATMSAERRFHGLAQFNVMGVPLTIDPQQVTG